MATKSFVSQDDRCSKENEEARQAFSVYACPTCEGPLQTEHDGLRCRVCSVTYPILDGIPDFIAQDLRNSPSRDLRHIATRDGSILIKFAASTYEKYIYPLVCNLFGGWHSTSLQELARYVSDIVGATNGVILDVACGPGTYGRRIASASRTVYGIDACLSMLRQGALYVEQDGLHNVHFARALVEALPFPAGLFDAAICAGSLNHFSDTVLALREINRTMKAGAPLAVMCFAISNRGLLKYKFLRDRMEEKSGGHIFAIPDLERYAAEAGFEGFRPHVHGAILVFSARKRLVQH